MSEKLGFNPEEELGIENSQEISSVHAKELLSSTDLNNILETVISAPDVRAEEHAKLEMALEEGKEIEKSVTGKTIDFPGKKIIAAGMMALSLIAVGMPKESRAAEFHKGYVTGFAVTEVINRVGEAHSEKYFPEKNMVEKVGDMIKMIDEINLKLNEINERHPELDRALKNAKIKLDEAQKKYDTEFKQAGAIGKLGKVLNSAPGGRPANELYEYKKIEEEIKLLNLEQEKLTTRKSVLESTLTIIHKMSGRKHK